MAQQHIRIAVIGDVHEYWDLQEDEKALRFLQADVVLFTGDFGLENLGLVESIAALKIPKAAILGNHDAGYSLHYSQRSWELVEHQLQMLKEQHVGYSRIDFPLFGFSVVGGRPLSRGGNQMYQEELIQLRYGIHNMEESARKICEAASGTPEGHFVVFLAHNGPAGLGSKRDDICGEDWLSKGGDHGDKDLAQALSSLKTNTRMPIPLVVFGHMHKQLAYGSSMRKMIKIGDDGTIYLNGAIVPRVQSLNKESSCYVWCKTPATGTLRAFTMIDIQDKVIQRISETWVAVVGNRSKVEHETVLFERNPSKND